MTLKITVLDIGDKELLFKNDQMQWFPDVVLGRLELGRNRHAPAAAEGFAGDFKSGRGLAAFVFISINWRDNF